MKINFEGLFPNDFEKYSEAYSNLVSIRPPPNSEAQNAEADADAITDLNIIPPVQPSLFRISFPFNDMQYLIETKAIKDSDARHFQNQFFYSPKEEADRIQHAEDKNKRRKNVIYKADLTSHLVEPGNLYTFNADDDFPQYIDENVVMQFRNDVKTIPLNGRPENEVNINDDAFRSMILTSRKFSRVSQSTPTKDSSDFSPQ